VTALFAIFVLLTMLACVIVPKKPYIQTSAMVKKGVFIESPTSTVVLGPDSVRKAIMKIKKEPSATQEFGLSRVLAIENFKTRSGCLSARRNVALSHLTLMCNTCRRFGVVIYDDEGLVWSYIVYCKEPDQRIAKELVTLKVQTFNVILSAEIIWVW